jgi:hypothetical protein
MIPRKGLISGVDQRLAKRIGKLTEIPRLVAALASTWMERFWEVRNSLPGRHSAPMP